MYEAQFELRESPFSLAPNPRFVFLSERHREALAHLLYGLREGGGFVQLTGEVGTGKTTICRTLLRQLPDDVDVALIFNPLQSAAELLLSILQELGGSVGVVAQTSAPAAEPSSRFDAHSLKQLTDALYQYLLDASRRGRRTVVIVDEAQNLRPEVLETLRLLTNLETDEKKLLQIFLIGQPELKQMLSAPAMRQIAQRVTARFHLRPLDAAQTAHYVRHRLSVAGCERCPFDAEALRTVHRLSGGIPRVINMLADRALLGAFVRESAEVDAQLVSLAHAELDLPAAAVGAGAGSAGAGGTEPATSRVATDAGPASPPRMPAERPANGPGEVHRSRRQPDRRRLAAVLAIAVLAVGVGVLLLRDTRRETVAPELLAWTGDRDPATADVAAVADAPRTRRPSGLEAASKGANGGSDGGLVAAANGGGDGAGAGRELVVRPAPFPLAGDVVGGGGPGLSARRADASTPRLEGAAHAMPVGPFAAMGIEPALMSPLAAGRADRPAALAPPESAVPGGLPALPRAQQVTLTARGAQQRLAAAWGLSLAAGQSLCAQVAESGLACLEGDGGLARALAFDRPVSIELRRDPGPDNTGVAANRAITASALAEPSHVVVLAMDADRVRLATPDAARWLSRDWLRSQAGARYTLLWRPPEDGLTLIKPWPASGSRDWLEGALMRWLVQAAGLPPARLAALQNAPLVERIQTLQAHYGLDTDGIAGPMTLAMLTSVLGMPERPTLLLQDRDRLAGGSGASVDNGAVSRHGAVRAALPAPFPPRPSSPGTMDSPAASAAGAATQER
ncbi:MAG: AAA family ATPase [Gammaproteobacteria bacterium]|nr:AAA family ATPase [Gammaproteobacteria bacterium]